MAFSKEDRGDFATAAAEMAAISAGLQPQDFLNSVSPLKEIKKFPSKTAVFIAILLINISLFFIALATHFLAVEW
jgi:hypothetical protein